MASTKKVLSDEFDSEVYSLMVEEWEALHQKAEQVGACDPDISAANHG